MKFDSKSFKVFKEESFYNLNTIFLRNYNNSKEVKKEKDVHNGAVLVIKNSLKQKNETIKEVSYITKHVDNLRKLVNKNEFLR